MTLFSRVSLGLEELDDDDEDDDGILKVLVCFGGCCGGLDWREGCDEPDDDGSRLWTVGPSGGA